MCVGNESLITRARNTIISYFFSEKMFTHLLFIDGDIQIQKGFLNRLLDRKKDVIGVPVPLKGVSNEGRGVFNVGEVLDKVNGELWEVDRVGTAVFMLSRRAVESLIEEASIYKSNPLTVGNKLNVSLYDVFKVGVKDNEEYLSEDYWVCRELRRLGYKIYIDIGIRTIHHGMSMFT